MINEQLLPSFDVKSSKYGKRKFTKYEDSRLTELIAKYGTKSWNSIASEMPGRSSRQCRERYANYLQPNLTNGPWTDEEENTLLEKFESIGPKWAAIAKFFESRSDVNVKNHWAAMKRRRITLIINSENSLLKKSSKLPEVKEQKKKTSVVDSIFGIIDESFLNDSIFGDSDSRSICCIDSNVIKNV